MGSPNPPPPAEGLVNVSPGTIGTLEKVAPRYCSFSVPWLSQTPCGIEGKPPWIPQVTDRPRSQQSLMPVPVASVRVPPFCTPNPPRCFPGPAESTAMLWEVVRTGLRRSWPSTGCTASPVPKTGDVAEEPSFVARPPQPPAIQSYHLK